MADFIPRKISTMLDNMLFVTSVAYDTNRKVCLISIVPQFEIEACTSTDKYLDFVTNTFNGQIQLLAL